ncbi:T9SS type A sorting domain-containing protein, partial [bacterium]|nr:T9SS type A sorting domain-containing protein [bacterium]
WGHESGPYHPTLNPTGQGDTLLSDSVTFIPWLTAPPDTTQPSAIRPEPVRPVVGTWDLQAVFPNPFNNAFTLSLAGFTGNAFRLAMHNVLGQEVAELYSGPMLGGSYSFTVSAELASGIYFIVAHDDLVTESIKVVLLK